MKTINDDKLTWVMTILITLSTGLYGASRALSSTLQILSLLIGFYLLYKKKSALSLSKTQKTIFSLYAIFLLFLTPSIIFSMELKKSLEIYFHALLVPFVQCLLLTLLEHSRKRLFVSLGILTCIFTIENMVGIYQVFFLNNLRPPGFQNHPVLHAGIFLIMAPLMIALACDSENYSKNLSKLARFCLPFHFCFFVSSHTRTNWLLLPLISLMANIKFLFKSKKAICIVAICVLIFGCTIASNPKYTNRFSSISNTTTDQSNLGRLFIWKVAYDIFEEKPLTGIGIGAFKDYYHQNKTHYGKKYNVLNQYFFKHFSLPHAHNNALQLLSEAGILGFLGFLIFIIGSLFVTAKNWFKSKDSLDLLIFSIFFGYYVLMGILDPTIYIHKPALRYFWVVIPILLQLKMMKFKD